VLDMTLSDRMHAVNPSNSRSMGKIEIINQIVSDIATGAKALAASFFASNAMQQNLKPITKRTPMHTYKYIYKPTNGYSCNDNEILENDYYKAEDLVKKFTVAKEIPSISNANEPCSQVQPRSTYVYMVFNNIEEFEDYLAGEPVEERRYHEVIFGWMKQKLKFDIDFKPDNQMTKTRFDEILTEIDTAIIELFYLLYQIDITDNIITTTSSSEEKYSYHKIISGYYVSGCGEAQEFTKKLLQLLPYDIHHVIDTTVNKKLQNFRILGCHKLDSNRVKVLESMQASVTLQDTIIQYIDESLPLPKLCLTQATVNIMDNELYSDDIDSVMELLHNHNDLMQSHDLKSVHGSLLCFRRTRASLCTLCQRIHESDNSLMAVVNVNNDGVGSVYIKCRRNPTMSKFVGNFCSVKVSDEDAIGVLADDQTTGITGMKLKSLEGIIGRAIKSPAKFPDRMMLKSKENILNEYCEPNMRAFEHVDTLCVIAAMKMGKTKKLLEYINTNFQDTNHYTHSIKFISFRQTFSANIKSKFEQFALYSDIKGDLTQSKLIVQVESLHRMQIGMGVPPPDLVILDEVELIVEQFDSGLLKQFSKAWAVFQYLIEHSKHVICMDAALSDRTISLLRRLRVDKKQTAARITIHHNTYQNAVDDHYYFTPSKTQWYAQLYADVDNGLKIAVATSSLAEAEILKQNLQTKYQGDNCKRVGFYSSKTPISIKKEHFANVDEFWSTYDIMIYTPTVSAGVSFERCHFDKVYAWFTDMSCNVEVCLQMLGRIRDVKLKEYIIGLNLNGGYLPTSIESIKDSVYKSRENLYKVPNYDLLMFEYDNRGMIKYYESEYFHLWLHNTRVRNLSRNSFVKRFASYLNVYGANMHVLENVFDNAILNDIEQTNDETREQLNGEKHTAIATASELTDQEVGEIQDKFLQQREVSEKERNSYDKYRLRRDYNWDFEITPEFVKRYKDKKMVRIYKNLSRILAHSNPDIALDKIKEEERDHYEYIMSMASDQQHADVNRRYVYDQHRIAIGLIMTCGWYSLTDPGYMTETELFDAFRAKENQLYSVIADAAMNNYGLKQPSVKMFKYNNGMSANSYVNEIVQYINKILTMMYGIKITTKKNEHMYKLSIIKHFTVVEDCRSITKPSVFAKWQPPSCHKDTTVQKDEIQPADLNVKLGVNYEPVNPNDPRVVAIEESIDSI
jgi:hypothetical protein